MRNVIATRYAEALFAVAKERNQLDQVSRDWEVVSLFYDQEPQLKILLGERLTVAQKKEIARSLWGKLISNTLLTFIHLVIDKHRERFLEEMAKVYHELLMEERNMAVAEVKTAYPIDQGAEERLRKALEQRMKKKIKLRISVHPELIGGLIVKVGDRVFDGSVSERLKTLGTRLVNRSLGKLEVEG